MISELFDHFKRDESDSSEAGKKNQKELSSEKQDLGDKIQRFFSDTMDRIEDVIDDVEEYGLFNQWEPIYKENGFQIQADEEREHYRLLNPKNELICKGSRLTVYNRASKFFELPLLMQREIDEVMDTLDEMELSAGDILAVDRFLTEADGSIRFYRHYAVYVGNGRVIHYAAENGAFSVNDSEIHEASILDFIQDAESFYVLDFDEKGENKPVPHKMLINDFANKNNTKWFALLPVMDLLDTTMGGRQKYHVFSPEETVRRARSRIGEKEYNLVTNNCEHFAIWCKTGMDESYQVNELGCALKTVVHEGKEKITDLLEKWIDFI